MTRTSQAVAIALLLLLTGCRNDGGGAVTPLTPTSISVGLSKVILVAVGETTQVFAEVRDQNGNVMAGQAVTWSSSNVPVAEVSGTGLVTAAGQGSAVILASAGAVSGAATIQVDQEAGTLEKSSGDGQTGVVGQTLPVRPEVLMTDALGSPVPNRTVQFSVTGGGGTVVGAAITGADGRAAVDWELGTLLGLQRLRATFAQFAAEFTATAVAGPATSITKVSGDFQSGVVMATLAFPMVVKLEDALGNPSVGQEVEFVTSAGSLSSPVATTGDDGLASSTLTLPASTGLVTVTASVPNLGLTDTFTATAIAGVPVSLDQVSGDMQIGPASTALPFPMVARLTDASGNPVPLALVLFTTTAGSLSAASAGTDSQGLVSVVLTLPATAGTTTVTMSTVGVPDLTYTAQTFIQVGLGAGLTVGGNHNCARAGSNQAWHCWGNNLNQQLGVGAVFSATPLLIGGVALVRVSAGGEHNCGLTSNGEAYCWGLNSSGQLGDGTNITRATPTRSTTNLHFVAINAGDSHTCALDGTGMAYCWGEGSNGQLGSATLTDTTVPSAVAGVPFRGISAGQDHTYALTLGGVAYCWGLNC